MYPGCLEAAGRKIVSKFCSISFSFAGSTAMIHVQLDRDARHPPPRAAAEAAPAASIVFKYVLRFMFTPYSDTTSFFPATASLMRYSPVRAVM